MVRSPRRFVERPPASSTIIPSGARSHGFDVQSSAASIAPSATSMCCQKPPNDRVFRAASSSRRILVWSSAFLLGPVPVVNTMALLRLDTSETRSRLPSRYAPSPRYAHQRVPSPGALANPATISPFDSMPISVPNVGIPRENSSVPSIGSMISRARPDLLAAFESLPPISSPSTSSASPLAATLARAISSTARSACVTAVPSPFLSIRKSPVRKYRMAIASASSAIAFSKLPYISPYPIASPDLTLLPHTPSIQSYRNVCSGQHWNRARPHSRSAARRGRPSQARPSRNGSEIWRESGDAAPKFLGGSRARWPQCDCRAQACLAVTRSDSRPIRSRSPRASPGGCGRFRAFRTHRGGILPRLIEKSPRRPQSDSTPRTPQRLHLRPLAGLGNAC